MSRKSFINLFNNQIFRDWYNTREKISGSQSVFSVGREDSAVKNQLGDAVIPLGQLAEYFNDPVISEVYSNANSQGSTAKALYDFVKTGAISGIEAREAVDYTTGQLQQQIFISDIPYKNASKYVDAHLDRVIDILNQQTEAKIQKPSFSEFVKSRKLQTGHVYGYVNTLSRNTVAEVVAFFKNKFSEQRMQEENQEAEKYKELLATQAIMEKQLESLQIFMDDVENILISYDIETSKLVGLQKGEMYANYSKSPEKSLWEFQSEEVNVKSGRAVGAAIGKQKYKNITEKTAQSLRGFFAAAINNPENANKALETFVQSFIKLGSTTGNFNILEQESSPKIKDLIVDSIGSILGNNPKKFKNVIENKVKLPSIVRSNITKDTVKIKQAKKSIEDTKKKISKAKTSLKNKQATTKRKVLELSTKSAVNLPMLLAQINRSLHDQLKKNMGRGSSVDVLNYRTGRFARSVKVEKLSESRQGMITAFYSYMKNPYGAFSRGGRQEKPYSRDPKNLISKSIREIAQTMVTNQLRAVNV